MKIRSESVAKAYPFVIGFSSSDGKPVRVEPSALAQHAALFGGSGFGKTYLSYILCREQLLRGASLVAIDPKPTTIRRLRAACAEAKVAPERVATIMPDEAATAPGMNPLLYGTNPEATAASVYDLLDRLVGFEAGPRIIQFLTYALRIAAWHRLALSDIPRLLHDDPFRAAILHAEPAFPISSVYTEAVAFFQGRFLSYSPSNRETTTQSIETRFTTVLGNSLFQRLFNAQENTVQFERLFDEQGAVLVSIGEGHGVTSTAARLLGAFVVRSLFDAASRRTGDRPVVLVCDEVRKIAGALEEGMRDVANMARESGIRLIIAGQHPGQLSLETREDILTSTAFKGYFNPGASDVDDAAALFTDREENPTPEPAVAYRGKLLAASLDVPLGGACPITAALSPPAAPLTVDLACPGATIRKFLRYAPGTVPPAYLEDGRRAADVLGSLPPGSSACLQWRSGTAILEIVPPAKPDLPPAQKRWAATLRSLGNGEAVVLIGGSPPEVVAVRRVEPQPDAPAHYVALSHRATCAPKKPGPSVVSDVPSVNLPSPANLERPSAAADAQKAVVSGPLQPRTSTPLTSSPNQMETATMSESSEIPKPVMPTVAQKLSGRKEAGRQAAKPTGSFPDDGRSID